MYIYIYVGVHDLLPPFSCFLSILFHTDLLTFSYITTFRVTFCMIHQVLLVSLLPAGEIRKRMLRDPEHTQNDDSSTQSTREKVVARATELDRQICIGAVEQDTDIVLTLTNGGVGVVELDLSMG